MPTNIERARVQELLSEGAQVVEVLSERQFRERHLPGALNIPLRKLDRLAREVLDPAEPVILYCWDSA